MQLPAKYAMFWKNAIIRCVDGVDEYSEEACEPRGGNKSDLNIKFFLSTCLRNN